MAELVVEIVKISNVDLHPNADRLEIINIEGMDYKIVSQKGNYQVGDLAVYFPIDSVIPDTYLDLFGIRTYYSKKLRAAKLRGVFSEGLLIPIPLIRQILISKAIPYKDQEEEVFITSDGHLYLNQVGTDLTNILGITKYEYPIPAHMAGEMEGKIDSRDKFPAPEHWKKYNYLLSEDEEVIITEKLHGTAWTCLWDKEGEVHIGSHNYWWKNNEANNSNVYVRAYREFIQPLIDKGIEFKPNTQLYGEVYGVQDIKYGLSNGKIGLAIYAIKKQSRLLNYSDMQMLCDQINLSTVPPLYIGPYSKEKVLEFNNSMSYLHSSSIMEGVVITPLIERDSLDIGRVCLKYISDRYLLRSEGTELK